MQSFSQFGSDVDKETKKQLDHGRVLMEILKQGQYKPVDVADQVQILYVASNGYLDDVSVEYIKAFEEQFARYMHDHYPEVANEIKTSGDFSKETEELLIKAIKEFKKVGFIHG